MRRRESLQRLGLVVSLTSMSGCAAILGGRENQKSDDGDYARSGDLESQGLKPDKDGDGHLVVVITVKNSGKKKESADVRVTVKTDGTVHEKTPKISVPAGETNDVRIPFEMTYENYQNASDRQISIDLK